MARTLAEVEAEYSEARSALSRALRAESYSHGSGSGNISVNRARIADLRKLIKELAEEIAQFEGVPTRYIYPVGGTPVT